MTEVYWLTLYVVVSLLIPGADWVTVDHPFPTMVGTARAADCQRAVELARRVYGAMEDARFEAATCMLERLSPPLLEATDNSVQAGPPRVPPEKN